MSEWPKAIWYNPMENGNRIEFNEPTKLFREWGREYVPAALLEDIKTAGWRSCIDHIIKPDSPCPVCLLAEKDIEIASLKSSFSDRVMIIEMQVEDKAKLNARIAELEAQLQEQEK